MISETDRISVSYYTNVHDEREHYSGMFVEDFQQHIVPVFGAKRESVRCILEPPNPEFQMFLEGLLPTQRRRYNGDFNDIIIGAIQLVAQELAYHGYAVFELVTEKDINERVHYKLESIYGKEIRIEGDKIIQVIHDDAAERLKIQRPLEIPIQKCFVIELPKSLGGKVNYLKFIDEFKALGQQSPMMSFRNPLRKEKSYNIIQHQRLHDLELWRKSKAYNWHHRQSGGDLFSGYYYILRQLQFRKSKITLRDYIVEQICEIISKLSERFGGKTKLKIEGLISSARIDKTIEEWRTGEVRPNSISEVL